jgi:uncharacterized protein DUF4350
MTEQRVFSPRLLSAWIIGAALAFACSLYLMTLGGDETQAIDGAGANTRSRSAIGYAGIAETLERLGFRVIKSEANSLQKLAKGSVLVIAEPRFARQQSQDAGHLLHEAKSALLILPKWRGVRSERHPGWIADAESVSEFEAIWTLNLAVDGGKLARESATQRWTVNELGITPDILEPVQLVKSPRLRPIVASEQGALLAEFRDKDRRLWVLADPDVIANHGIGRKDNAAFSVALLNALRRDGGAIVFDETVHGFLAKPADPFKLLFDSRFISVTLQGAIAVALLLWAAVARFGAPLPAPPPLDPGKRGLVRNAAKLITSAGHRPLIVRRYVDATVRDVARRLHAPRGLSDEGLIQWLQRVGRARKANLDCAPLYRRTLDETGGKRESSSLVALVRDVYAWKQEIIDGDGGDPRARREDPARSSESGRRTG